MNRAALGQVRNTRNFRIIHALMCNPGKWMTAADICRSCGDMGSRAVGQKLKYLRDEFAGIEVIGGNGKCESMYRYVGDQPTTAVQVPMSKIVGCNQS